MPNGTIESRVRAVLDVAVKEQRVVGATAWVMQHGALVARVAVGLADRESNTPMRDDTPFRYASLTKPIVTAAALTLVERGVLSLEDLVTRHLDDFAPRFAGRTVPITLQHLLTHTSGLGYAFLEGGTGPYHAAGVSDGLDQPALSLAENLRRLAPLPLAFLPGSAFRYSLSTDVLGAVMERATGTSLPELVEQLVTQPLGMETASFTPRNVDALATPYADGAPAPRRMFDGIFVPFGDGGVTFAPSRVLDARSYPSGGAGMVGTAPDFLRFLEALRTRSRVFPRERIDAMLRDQIPSITSPILGDGWGYGYGTAVLRDPVAAQSPLHTGSVRWGGAYGHAWFIDPVAEISAVLLTNTAFEGMAGRTRTEFETAVATPEELSSRPRDR